MSTCSKSMYRWFLLLLLLCASCSPKLERALGVATKSETNARVTQQALNEKHRKVVAENAAALFPIKEQQETTTEVVQGNAEELKAQLRKAEQEADSLEAYLKTLPVKPYCEPEVAARDRVIAALRARIASLSQQAKDLKADLQRVTTTKTQENIAAIRAAEIREQEVGNELAAEKKAHKLTKAELAEKKRKLRICYIIGGISLLVLAARLFIRIVYKI